MTAEHRQLVVFSLGDEEYALPIESVHEIIRYSEPRAAASSSASIRGMINLRGKIVPVHDLTVRLGLAPDAGGQESNIVIVDSAAGVAGVVVDEVDQVLTVETSTFETLSGTDDAVEAIVKVDDRLIVLLDPAGVFASDAVAA